MFFPKIHRKANNNLRINTHTCTHELTHSFENYILLKKNMFDKFAGECIKYVFLQKQSG